MRFKPGQSGNPVRPPVGSRNKRTILADKLFDDGAGDLTTAAIKLRHRGRSLPPCAPAHGSHGAEAAPGPLNFPLPELGRWPTPSWRPTRSSRAWRRASSAPSSPRAHARRARLHAVGWRPSTSNGASPGSRRRAPLRMSDGFDDDDDEDDDEHDGTVPMTPARLVRSDLLSRSRR